MITHLRKPERTPADTIAAGATPILIIILIGSFVLFLFDLAYSGPHGGQLKWTLCWFVLAIVFVSRISIEESFQRASLYGVALAWATAMWMFRFIDFVFGVLFFLAFIWWCASKLVWDCGVVDEDQDASGEGLIAVAGFGIPGEVDSKISSALQPWWKRAFRNRPSSGKSHAHGLWIVYFSLLALPLFGVGYAAIPIENSSQRQSAIYYVWSYIASALGLLLITSFLGLRRYLRQRYLPMPWKITAGWFRTGITFGGAIMLASFLFPRPADNVFKPIGLFHSISSPDLTASKRASSESQPARGEGQPNAADRPDAPGNKGSDPKANRNPGNTKGGNAASPTPARPTEPPARGPTLLRLTLLALVLYFLLRYWKTILDFIRSLWGDVQTVKLATPSKTVESPTIRQAPFSSFKNPFQSGKAARMDLEELVVYTFRALEAWAIERGRPRDPSRTAMEFAQDLTNPFFTMEADMAETARAYSHWIYGQKQPDPEIRERLQSLWQSMSTRIEKSPQLRAWHG